MQKLPLFFICVHLCPSVAPFSFPLELVSKDRVMVARNLAYKLGLRLSRIHFVRSAIDERADLHSSGKLLTFRFVIGLILMPLSFIICWPLISLLAGMAVHLNRPLIVLIGGPLLYIISAVGFAIGVALAGKKAARVFFRWRARIWVEWLLSNGRVEDHR